MLEGAHLVDVYLARIGVPETLVVLDDALGRAEVAALAARVPRARTLVVARRLFGDVATLPPDVGVLAVVATPKRVLPPPGEFCLLLDDVQDPGNVGTIVRTAAAAGVEQVLLSKHCAFAWSPKALRAGQGAQFLTCVVEDVDLDAWIRAFRAARGRVLAAVARDGARLYDTALRDRLAIVVGSEGKGVSPGILAQADVRVTIPLAPGSESLNAAAACAVVLFEAVRQRNQ